MSHAELLAQLPDVTKAETGDVHDRKRRLERRATQTRITIFDIQIARRKLECWDWIERVLERQLPGNDIQTVLMDGCVLCELLNVMFDTVIKTIHPPGSPPYELRDNIAQFLLYLKKLDVFPLFVVEDLYANKGIHRVCTTIERLAAVASSKGFHVKWERYGRTMEKRLVERETPIDVADIPYDPVTEEPQPEAEPEPEPEAEEPVIEIEEFAIEEEDESHDSVVAGVESMKKNEEEPVVELSPLDQKLRKLANKAFGKKKGVSMLNLAMAKKKYDDVVEYLMTHPGEYPGSDINEKDELGNTPLHNAVSNQNAHIVDMLLKAGADPNARNKRDEIPLHIAIIKSDDSIIEMLILKGSDVDAVNGAGDTVLLAGICDGEEDECILLMDKCENLNCKAERKDGETTLEAAIRKEKNEVVARLLKQFGADPHKRNKDGENALHVACRVGNQQAVDILVEFDRTLLDEKDKNGNTPLHSAVAAGHSDMTKKLIEAGADINAKNSDGNSAIMLAVEVDNDKFIDFLASEFGADVGAASNGHTALYRAAWLGNAVIVSVLCKRGADVNQQNLEGWSPLHAASDRGHKEVVDILVDTFKANVNIQCKQGTTPLYHACEHNHPDVAKYLIEHGADVNLGAKHGWVPIHISVSSSKLTKMLLDTGKVDLTATIAAMNDYTALHMAVSIPHPSMHSIKFLLDAGASQKAANSNGQTPLHLAVYRGHMECVKALCEHPTNKPVFKQKNKAGRTALDLACYGALADIAEYLADQMGVKCPKVADKNKLKLKKSSGVSSAPNPDAYFKKMKKGVDKDTDAEIESVRQREAAEKKAEKERKKAEKEEAKRKKEEEKKAKKEKKEKK